MALWQVTWTSDALVGDPEQPPDTAIAALSRALVDDVVTWNAPAAGDDAASGLTGADPLEPGDAP